MWHHQLSWHAAGGFIAAQEPLGKPSHSVTASACGRPIPSHQASESTLAHDIMAGPLIDVMGARFWFGVSFLAAATVAACTALATQPWMLYASRLPAVLELATLCAKVLITERSSEAGRARMIGYNGVALGVGFVVRAPLQSAWGVGLPTAGLHGHASWRGSAGWYVPTCRRAGMLSGTALSTLPDPKRWRTCPGDPPWTLCAVRCRVLAGLPSSGTVGLAWSQGSCSALQHACLPWPQKAGCRVQLGNAGGMGGRGGILHLEA